MATPKVRRFWFVIPNDIQGNGQCWYGPKASVNEFAAPEPARAQARDGGRRPALREEEDGPREDDGYGLYLAPKEQKEVLAFTTKAKAQEYAKYQATMNPQKLFGIFACEQIFETTEPTVLQKKFNDAGELVLESQGV